MIPYGPVATIQKPKKVARLRLVQRPPRGSTSLSMMRRIGPGADR